MIAEHIPALQIIIPLFSALLSAVTFNRSLSWAIATISSLLGVILSIYAINFLAPHFLGVDIFYVFGGWKAPFGIEYRLDALNQPIIMFMNLVLLFFLLFGKELINKTITAFISNRRQHVFYSILLFAHVGYLGMVSTNDMFNLYVFIEISSLATYVLLSNGPSANALIGAFNYLMLGTIGATLILIGIGFFLASTGSLNISDIANILKNIGYSKITVTAIIFFLTGVILKMAFFPMHFWMVRAYSSCAPFLLTYLAAISTIVGVYIILRFMHFIIIEKEILQILNFVLRPAALFTIAICTFLAIRTDSFKKLVIYSAASQLGYVFLLITIPESRELLFQFLLFDSINKIALFTMIAHIEHKSGNLSFENFKPIKNSVFFKILAAFILLFSTGLPLTSMFILKIQLYNLLLSSNLIIEFVIVLLAGVLALLYHLRLVRSIFFNHKINNGTVQITTNLYGLTAIVIVQFLTLFCAADLVRFAEYTESTINREEQ